jgi:hypothetical protein
MRAGPQARTPSMLRALHFTQQILEILARVLLPSRAELWVSPAHQGFEARGRCAGLGILCYLTTGQRRV